MARTARLLAATAVLLAGPSAHANDIVSFSAGSLIIPMQGNYQNECGTASAYGLVWRILQSNQKGHFNEAHPVTVYWAIDDSKKSPNRCVPNNLTKNPSGGAWDGDAAWNDGCDASIVNSGHEPVVPVDYAAAWPAANNGMYPYGEIPAFNSEMYPSIPSYRAVTLDDAVNPRFTAIQYLGGPFIIAKKDAANVIAFLKSGDSFSPVGTGSSGPLSRFTTPCTCNFNLDLDGKDTRCNYVNMHQATIGFDAPVGRRMSEVPPKIALLAAADDPKLETSEIWGRGSIYTTILDQYLKNAGLWVTGSSGHQDSGGCPVGSLSRCTLNGSQASGAKYSGLIYDAFSANVDLITIDGHPHGLLNDPNPDDPTGNTPLYRVFWTPHWVSFNTDNGAKYTGPKVFPVADSERKNALENIAHYADRPHTGLMAECASLESYEGSLNHLESNVTTPTSATHFQYTEGIEANFRSDRELSAAFSGRNCSDPNYDHISPCMFFPHPGSPFAQIGDFYFEGRMGHVQQYRANAGAGSEKRPWVSELAVSWVGASGVDDYETDITPGRNDGWSFFSVGQKDNDPLKAMILYLAGHDYGSSLPGNRVVLNTLLNLGGDPPPAPPDPTRPTTGSERALVPPVAFNDPNGSTASGTRSLVIQGTFTAVSGYPEGVTGVKDFFPETGAQWVFPYIPGHLRAHSLEGGTSLKVGSNALDSAVLWDADDEVRMPAPGRRNLFTYFGGSIGLPEGKSSTRDSFGVTSVHSVFQTGWKVQRVSYESMDPGKCVDELAYGTDPKDSTIFGFVKGHDDICDLQEALDLTEVRQTDRLEDIQRRLGTELARTNAKRMIQRVRGFCWSTDGANPNMEPTAPIQCDGGATSLPGGALNVAHLGGIVHSTPVVVGESHYTKNRPTVAYVGGYDGQLHAILVSRSSADYVPPGELEFPPGAQSAAIAFSNPNLLEELNSGAIPSGRELWSFLPASQLPLLKTNGARLDSAPMVEDVFVDLAGSGIRQWHTVLVMSVGGSGREVFAMDVTDPLAPVLLWDLVGSIPEGGPKLPNLTANKRLTDADGNLSDSNPTRFSFKWKSGVTRYRFDEASNLSDLFDYSDLGAASGVSLAQFRRGLDPVYAAFVTTNSANPTATKAVEVFAIDIASGQKLWQWERPYSIGDNAVPSVATAFNIISDVPRLFVPDQDGRLWELDAQTGRNVNYHDDKTIAGCSSEPCELALLDANSSMANPQPLTTNVAIVRVPSKVEDGSPFKGYEGARLVLVGTAGADWVGSSVKGRLYVLLLDENFRKPIAQGGTVMEKKWSQSEALESARNEGLLQAPASPAASFPYELDPGEHLYGAITSVGQRIFFETAAAGIMINDPMQLVTLSDSIPGATYVINEAAGKAFYDTLSSGKANFGGTAVLATSDGIYTLTSEVNNINVAKAVLPTDGSVSSLVSDRSLNPDPSLPYQLMNWLRRRIDP